MGEAKVGRGSSHTFGELPLLNFCSTLARYNEMLFMIDTCQANTMYSKIMSPNILATGSSELGESSYSVSKVNWTCTSYMNKDIDKTHL